jgi:hypothetical protein
VRGVGRFVGHLGHQHRVAGAVTAAQGADIEGKLVAEDQMKDWHRLTLRLLLVTGGKLRWITKGVTK